MSQSYYSQKIYTSETENEISVRSSRCMYKVWTDETEISLVGPGVNINEERSEDEPELPREDLAIYYVLMFENGLWPEGDS